MRIVQCMMRAEEKGIKMRILLFVKRKKHGEYGE
jgi:hypothetical protein